MPKASAVVMLFGLIVKLSFGVPKASAEAIPVSEILWLIFTVPNASAEVILFGLIVKLTFGVPKASADVILVGKTLTLPLKIVGFTYYLCI